MNSIRKRSFLKIACILGVFIFAFFTALDAYADIAYEYYPNGRVKSITYSPAKSGMLYVEYLNEDWNGRGYGRVYREIKDSKDADGAVAYEYSYSESNTMLAVDLSGGGIDSSLIIDLASSGVRTYTNDSTWTSVSVTNPVRMEKARLDAGNVDDIMLDFGPGIGIYKYMNGGSLEFICYTSSEAMYAADIDNSGKESVLVDFGPGIGLYKYVNNNSMEFVCYTDPKEMYAAGLDADPGKDMLIDFGTGVGIYKYMNGTSMEFVCYTAPQTMKIGDLDGNGLEDALIDFGTGVGMYKYMNNSSMDFICYTDPQTIYMGDFDGNGVDDALVDFGDGIGLYKYSNSGGLKFICYTDPESIYAADINGDGIDDALVDFGEGIGLYKYINGSGLEFITYTDPDSLVIGDFDGNGVDDAAIDFGKGIGLYKYMNGSSLKFITYTDPVNTCVVDLDSDGKDDLVVDFGAAGTYKYFDTGNTLEWITNTNSNRTNEIKAYANTDYTGLIYTATYDASGAQLSKDYNNQYSYWGGDPDLLKRKIEGATGNIYEYDNEDTYGNGAYGKPLVESSHTTTTLGGLYPTDAWYKAYYWDDDTVGVAEHEGEYSTGIDDPVYSGIYTSEQRVGYEYLHNGDYSLTTAPESWDIRSKGIYNTNGGGDENLIEGYVWYEGAGYVPGDEDFMKSYNIVGGSGNAKEWDETEEHKIITQAYYTTTTPLVAGRYTPNDNYSTYSWGDVEVETMGYAGRYEVSSEYTTHTDVIADELRVSYLHEYNGIYTTLFSSNWDIRQMAVYSTDGATFIEAYSWYEEAGVWGDPDLMIKSYNDETGYLTEWDASGKMIMVGIYTDTSIVYEGTYTVTNRYEEYDWDYDTGQVLVNKYDGVYSVEVALSAPYSTMISMTIRADGL
jgi:hypothetical protein